MGTLAQVPVSSFRVAFLHEQQEQQLAANPAFDRASGGICGV